MGQHYGAVISPAWGLSVFLGRKGTAGNSNLLPVHDVEDVPTEDFATGGA